MAKNYTMKYINNIYVLYIYIKQQLKLQFYFICMTAVIFSICAYITLLSYYKSSSDLPYLLLNNLNTIKDLTGLKKETKSV